MHMIFDDLIIALENSPHKDLLYPFLNDYDEMAHWLSVISTRNYGVDLE